jgi:hypothetical protein
MSGSAFEVCIVTECDLFSRKNVSGGKIFDDHFAGSWDLRVRYTGMVEAGKERK